MGIFNSTQIDSLRPFVGYIAGSIFAIGHWIWIYVIVVYLHETPNGKLEYYYFIPGIVGTAALIFINSLNQEALPDDPEDQGDEDTAKVRGALFIGFITSIGMIAAGGWIAIFEYLVDDTPWRAIGTVVQPALITLSTLIYFLLKGPSEDGWGYSAI